jgi:hypothetical protein
MLWLILLLIAQATPCNSFAQKTKLKNYLPKDNRSLFLWGGLPGEFINENINQEIAIKYNFRYYRYAGCISPENWYEESKKHNARLKKRIAQQFGDSWETDFKKEYTRLKVLFQRADSILSYDSFFWIGREQSIAPPMDIEQTYYSEIHRDSIIRVMLCSANEWLNNKLVVFREFELNLTTKKVTLVAHKPKEEPLISVNQ